MKKEKWKCILTAEVSASFTVEAALVVPVVLFTIVALILHCYQLHDEAMLESRLMESLETYVYSSEDERENGREIAQDGQQYFKMSPSSITIQEELAGFKIHADTTMEDEEYTLYSYHRPLEKIMRLMTVKDGLEELKEKSEKKGSSGGTDENNGEGNP